MNIKKNKYFLSKKIITLGLFPIFLILFWIICSLLFNNKISFSVLLYQQPSSDITSLPQGALLQGNKIKGEFKAKDNYLGLMMLKFAEYGKHDFSGEDVLVFRIKQKNDKNWYYSNTYRSGLLDNNLLFPFGFPVIDNSKDEIYEFEIESISGSKSNGVEINRNSTALFSGYQYPRYEITKNKKSTIGFILKKIYTSFTNLDFLLSSTLYLAPLLLYFGIYIYLSTNSNLYILKPFINIFLFILILMDIFLTKEIYPGTLMSLGFVWIFLLRVNKKSSKYSFIFAIVLIFIWISIITLRINNFQNKINVWVYMLLIIGLFQAIIEERYTKLKKTVKKI